MDNIRLAYQGFWGDFDFNDNIFTWLLRHKYNIIFDQQQPDIVIGDNINRIYKNCKYIYFSGEPYYPTDESIFDFGIAGFHKDNESYFRLPLYLYYIYEYKKRGLLDFDYFDRYRNVDLESKTNFCVLITRGFNGYRAEFVQKLMKYKRVDMTYGPYKNITVPGEGGSINGSISKVNFIRRYKFTISFENCINNEGFNGYTTEKLIEPMIASSLPLYWGNYRINEDFNTNSFLNIYDYKDENEFIEKIIELDNNDNLYRSYFYQKLRNENNKLLDIEQLPVLFLEKLKI